MFKTLRDAFKIADIRRRLAFTLLVLVIVRLGSQIPTPGINTAYLTSWWNSQTTSAFNFFTTITGTVSYTHLDVYKRQILV